MAARKKTAKKTAARGSKTPKRTVTTAAKSARNSAARKSKASKSLTKLEKAALAARRKAAKAKAAAKSAKTSAAPSVKTAAKHAASASKTARPPIKQPIETRAKGAAPSVKTPPSANEANEAKENHELNAAKAKIEVKNSAPIARNSPAAAKTVVGAAKSNVAAPAKPGTASEAPRAPAPAQPAVSPVVALQSAAKPAPRVDDKAAAKPAAPRHGFKAGEFVVYPAHGVGQIVAIEEQEVAGFRLELFVITFVKDKMMLRVPVGKAASVGMRKLSDPDLVSKSLDTLLGRARIKRTMWSRRAQEYEAKINSGDLIAIAEVVRDLYRSEAQPEQSYSERQLYEAAVDRMAREVAVVQKIGEGEALKLLEGQLQKGQRGRKTEAAAAGETASDADVEEAA